MTTTLSPPSLSLSKTVDKSTAISGDTLVYTLGAVAAHVGGAAIWTGAWRVTVWGVVAMGVTAGAGALFGTVA